MVLFINYSFHNYYKSQFSHEDFLHVSNYLHCIHLTDVRFLCKKVNERMRVIQKCIHTVTFDVSFVMDEF